jgi:hypothetical protein
VCKFIPVDLSEIPACSPLPTICQMQIRQHPLKRTCVCVCVCVSYTNHLLNQVCACACLHKDHKQRPDAASIADDKLLVYEAFSYYHKQRTDAARIADNMPPPPTRHARTQHECYTSPRPHLPPARPAEQAGSDQTMRPYATSVCTLKLLVYAALSY